MTRYHRPRDPAQLAKLIVDLATGQAVETDLDAGKDPAAVSMGKKGGKARADNMTADRRSQIAKKAAAARWGKKPR